MEEQFYIDLRNQVDNQGRHLRRMQDEMVVKKDFYPFKIKVERMYPMYVKIHKIENKLAWAGWALAISAWVGPNIKYIVTVLKDVFR